MNLELTKRCNARCTFCSCWRIGKSEELSDYAPVVERFKPLVLSVSGGEPLMRKGYAELLAGMRPYCHYLNVITNGALLNEKSAKKLVGAGVDQICVSLDYLGEEHDEARKVPGLYKHLSEMIPALAKAGYRLALNTIIMESNLHEILEIAHRAHEWGVDVSFSAFCSLKSGDEGEMVAEERYLHLLEVIDGLRELKRRNGNIKNSEYYLSRIPKYFRDGHIPNCKAGYNWVQITPDGYVKQCSEMPRLCRYDEFTRDKLRPVECTKCWYACRGESEAKHFTPSRLLELIRA